MKNLISKNLKIGLFTIIYIVFGTVSAVAGQSANLYDDKRIETWAQGFLAGKREEVLLAVENDLKSGSPHPSAAYIWTQIQKSLGRLNDAPNVADAQLREALGAMPDIEFLIEKGEYKQLLEKYPAAKADEIKDVWALNRLAWAASNQFRSQEMLIYATALIRQNPNNFRAVWTILDFYDDDEQFYQNYVSLFKPDGEFGNTAAGRFLYPLISNRSFAALDQLALVEIWLKENPKDARAIVFKAEQLAALERYEEAAKTFQDAMTAFPFPLFWSENQARQLVRLGRVAEAKEVLKKYVPLKTKDASEAQIEIETEFANALTNAGERGEARKVFEEAIKKYPNDADLRYHFANLELTGERATAALEHSRKAAELAPNNLANQIQLMEVLQKVGKLQDALALFQATDEKFKQKSTDLFFRGTEIFSQMERFSEMLQLYERAVAEYPRSTWMNDNYAYALDKNGKTAEAIAVLRKRFEIDAPSSWDITNLRKWLVKTNEADGKAKANEELAALRKRFPWNQALWDDALGQIDGGDKTQKQIALWREAIAANPGQYWAWNKALWVLLNAERWDEAEKLTEEELTATAQSLPANRSRALYDRAIVIVEQAEKSQVSRERLEEGLQRFEAFRQTGSYLTSYYRWRATLFEGLGRNREAAESKLEAVKLSPDDYNLLFDFATKYQGEMGDGKRMSYFQRYVDRDPYNGERLNRLMHLLVMWYGSPVYAIQINKIIKERAPDFYSASYESMAWGKIGDAARNYENQYSKSTAIANSDRYIKWFETSRFQAQRGEFEVGFDEKDPLIYQVTYPDGLIVKRKQHPLSGKYMLIQVGAAKIECEYDEYGDNLRRITDSAGKEVRLLYYPDNTIKTLITSDGREISFVYNEMKKPTVISLKGVGQITVTYKPPNFTEIEKVDSSAGRAIALQVTNAFQELLSLIRVFEAGGNIANIPELPFKDANLDKLRTDYETKAANFKTANTPLNKMSATQAVVALAKYLVEHIADRRGYADEVRRILQPLITEAQKTQLAPPMNALAVESVGLWHQLLLATRKNGLSAEDFSAWSEMRDWLSATAKLPGANQAAAQTVFKKVEAKPLSLLKSAAWLPNSYLNSPGYWRRFNFSQILPANLRGNIQLNAVLVRHNNEVVVGTDKGLLVLRRGFWEWFGFDETGNKFSPNLPLSRLNAASNILSFAEDADGALFVGTANGLVKIPADYDGEANRFLTGEDGLPTPRIDKLMMSGSGVLIGTTKGLFAVRADKIESLPDFANQEVKFLRAAGNVILIGTSQGIFAFGNETIKLSDKAANDAVWISSQKKVYLLRATEIFTLNWDGKTKPTEDETFLQTQNQIVKINKIYGLAELPLDAGAVGVAVMTDRGLSIFRDAHFEHKDLPLADKSVGVFGLNTYDKRTYLLTSEGIYALERGQTMGDSAGRVFDLLTADDLGLTFVARGFSLDVVSHSNPSAGATPFDFIEATHLARDSEGRLIANDGFRIVRYEKGSTEPQELFSAQPLIAQGLEVPKLTSIVAASDGTIWVSAGASVFRWKDGTAEEFSILKDEGKFPSRTDMVSRVVETYDKRIWVICSNESHRFYRGQKLAGGILEWNGTKFERLDGLREAGNWFITGYTKIGDGAIVGTLDGFVQHRDERFVSYANLKDVTYKHLLERQPTLWLGTRGAKLGNDVWLFGTAGGIVAYQEGEWFYPDALNYKLPDDFVFGGNYGVRTVHAVETDKAGHIYAGTDRGLLIYDSGGGDAAAFLVSNHYEREYAFRLAEQKKLRQEADIILSGLPKESEVAKKVEQIRQAEREIEEIRQKIMPGVQFVPADRVVKNENDKDSGMTGDKFIKALSEAEQLKLKQALEDKEKAKNELLAAIQKENPSLYQLLELKPLDLKSLRENLKPDQVVVQYLPTEKNLYIQIVTRESSEIREVKVRETELQKRALQVAQGLSNGIGVRTRSKSVNLDEQKETANLRADLTWLYDQLLRPVENDLAGRKQIFIVPFGNLSYVPFAALIKTNEPKIEYAVEHYNFGYLPSMYLFDLVMRAKDSQAKDSLIFGDPDGSLSGAREEAKFVFQSVGGNLSPFIGEAATYETLKSKAGQSRILHFATHGRFFKPTAEESYILLANGRRLSIFEVMMLPLGQTEMVVLSACETGLSTQGLEYATMTRAFAQAGAPSVIATLWQVNDEASRLLMEKFYAQLKGKDRFTALAEAQREMLKSEDTTLKDPSSWAGYIPFGKP